MVSEVRVPPAPDARTLLADTANQLAVLGERFMNEARPEVAGPFLSAAGILASAVWAVPADEPTGP